MRLGLHGVTLLCNYKAVAVVYLLLKHFFSSWKLVLDILHGDWIWA